MHDVQVHNLVQVEVKRAAGLKAAAIGERRLQEQKQVRGEAEQTRGGEEAEAEDIEAEDIA